MIPLQDLLSKDDQLVGLLEASAQQGCDSLKALRHLVEAPDQVKSLAEFVEPRRREKAISREIGDLLCTTFVAAIEREDIEALSNALYKIPKTIEKVGERILLAPEYVRGIDLAGQVAMLEKAAQKLLTMIRAMRQGASIERVRDHNEDLQNIEGELDKLMLEKLKGVYFGQGEPGRMLFLKDLFELLERVADRCRDAGVVVTHMVLRNT